ncbi:MAG: hypothetical protein AABX11_07085 [Nanoarchaeota archaeon]|mgnify:CR=1 FL=1
MKLSGKLAIAGGVLAGLIGVSTLIDRNDVNRYLQENLPRELQVGEYGAIFNHSTNLPGYCVDYMMVCTERKRNLRMANIDIRRDNVDSSGFVESASVSRNFLGGWTIKTNNSIPGSLLSNCLKDGKKLNTLYDECAKEVGLRDTLSLPVRERHPYLSHWE